MHIEQIKPRGEVTLELRAADGTLKVLETHNLVVDLGLAFIASRMKDATAAAMTHMGVGTSSTAAADAQTALVTQLVRVALTSTTLVTTTVANDSIQYLATFPAGTATGAITEAGLFNAASAGTMLARTVFGVITKGADDTLTVTWKIIIA